MYSVLLSEHRVQSSFTAITTDHISGLPLPTSDIYKLKTFHLYKIVWLSLSGVVMDLFLNFDWVFPTHYGDLKMDLHPSF